MLIPIEQGNKGKVPFYLMKLDSKGRSEKRILTVFDLVN